jgi:ATP-dependent Lon protease
VNAGAGAGVKLLNRPAPVAFVESLKCGEQNLDARSRELVGDRDPRSHEFTVQLRAFDAARGGSGLRLAALIALCSALLQKSIKGGLVVVGGLNLGGSINPVHNAISVVELAVEKGAALLLMPVSSRRQLFELSDDMATRIDIQFYADTREALLKALNE